MIVFTGPAQIKKLIMKNSILFWTIGSLLPILALNDSSLAQSSVIQMPGEMAASSDTGQPLPTAAQFPASTLSPSQRKWEAILAQPHPEIPGGTILLQDLLVQLRQIGLPVHLDQTARDDALPEDELIRLGRGNEPLGVRLRNAWVMGNGCLAMIDQRLLLISLDVASDPEYFLTASYDVSELPTDPETMVDNITSSIDPDGWDITNGDGVLLTSIVNDRTLLVLSAPYYTHVKVRNLLRGWQTLSQTPINRRTLLAGTHGNGGSTVIAIPNGSPYGHTRRLRRYKRGGSGGRGRGGGGFGGGGRGGFGGGGGVF